MLYLLDRVQSGGHDVPVKKLLDRRIRGFENIKRVSGDIDCLIFVDNSIYNEPPIIVKSMYRNNICFINDSHDRELLWIDMVLDSDLKILNSNELKIVLKEHLQLCEDIQNSSNTFENTLMKSYHEKNRVLAKS